MGKLSRRKGARFEREIARRLSAVTGSTVERNLEEVRAGNSGDLVSDLPCTFQLKCGKAPSVWRALKEAQEAADGTGQFAVAVVRRNASHSSEQPEDVAVLSLDDFTEILSQLVAGGVW